jgi:hypothetical protein
MRRIIGAILVISAANLFQALRSAMDKAPDRLYILLDGPDEYDGSTSALRSGP